MPGSMGLVAAILGNYTNGDRDWKQRFGSIVYPWDRAALAGTSDITYSTNTTLSARVIVGDVITIDSGVVVTTMTGGAIIICNSFVNAGTLTASGKGSAGGVAAGTSSANGNPGTAAGQINSRYLLGGSGGGGGGAQDTYTGGAGGAAHGGAGGSAGAIAGAGGAGANSFMNLFPISDLWQLIVSGLGCGAGGGSGGTTNFDSGAGGAGGGGLLIVCGTFNNTGSVLADGINGSAPQNNSSEEGAGGGGGGGCVVVDAMTITSLGTVTAAKGLGHTTYGYDGGNGGDGTVIVMERWPA